MSDDKNLDDSTRIDAIRDILFGQQMQRYEDRFAALEKLLQERLDAARADAESTMEAHQQASAKAMDALREETRQLGQNLGAQQDEAAAQLEKLRAELLTAMNDQIEAAEQRSVSRNDLASLLRDLADRVEGR